MSHKEISIHKTSPEMVAALRVCLSNRGGAGGASYMVKMWQYALDGAKLAEEPSCEGGYNDALPYLPCDLESIGLPLTRTSRVLDVGCLGGYGLYDLASQLRRTVKVVPVLVGLDVDAASISLGKELARIWGKGLSVSFYKRKLEDIDVDLGCFDLVLCRLVLPYAHIHAAMAALRSYCKVEGVLVLQVHSPYYYVDRILHSFKSPRKMFYYFRPLVQGVLFGVLGIQLRGRWWQEVALNRRSMLRLLRSYSFDIVSITGHRRKPIYICKIVEQSEDAS